VDRDADRDAHHLWCSWSLVVQAETRETFVADKPAETNVIPYSSIVDSYKKILDRPQSPNCNNRREDWRYVMGHNENGTSSPSVSWISSSCRAPAKHGTCRHGRLISDRQTIEMVKARYTKINGSPPDEDTLKLERYRASQVRRCISRSTYRNFYGPDVTWIVCTSVHTS
jgi:hypothetical protein